MVVCFFSSIELRKAQDTHDARAAETKRRAAAVLKESQEKIAKVTALWCDVFQVYRADTHTHPRTCLQLRRLKELRQRVAGLRDATRTQALELEFGMVWVRERRVGCCWREASNSVVACGMCAWQQHEIDW